MPLSIRIQILLIALLFGMTCAFLQISPSVQADYVIDKININEDFFLKLTTLYFVSYAILQVPNGYILDAKGIEQIFPISIFIVFLGSIIYWLSDSIYLIGLSRIIIGAGCSTAYVTSIFIATKHFSKAFLPLLISLAEIAAGVGNYLAGNAYFYVLKNYGWDASNIIILLVLFALLMYSLFILKLASIDRQKRETKKLKSFSEMVSSIKNMLSSSSNVAVFAYSFFTWGVIMTFAGYWAKNYYVNMHGYSKEAALTISEIYWISFLVASLVVGAYVKSLKRVKKVVIFLSMLGVLSYSLMLTPILFGYSLLVFLTILSGISAAGVILAFYIIQYLVADQEKGLAISLNNFFIVIGGMTGQLTFSKAMSINYAKFLVLGEGVNASFYSGLIMLGIWAVLALVSIIFVIRKI